MQSSRVKVLYIDGQGRSGSTLLHNVLGQVDGFFAGGELREFWRRASTDDRPCGCGASVGECAVWRGVLEEAFGGLHGVDAQEMERLRGKARNRHSPLLLLPWRQQLLTYRLRDYLANLQKLYQGITASTGERVVIDSSKSLLYGYLLGMLPAIELYVVHIVRDPRGVAYSLQKRKDKGLPQFQSWNPVKSSLIWDGVNLTREAFWRHSGHPYLRMRYEDFVLRPGEGVERILDLVGEEATLAPFIDGRDIEMGPTHNVGGNTHARFKTGTVTLHPDEEWRRGMSRTDRAVVTASTWPLLLHYGYHR